jgi:hypothetical protein
MSLAMSIWRESMSLNTVDRYALAIELLSLGARINIISEETGISPKILRKAYFEMYQKSSPRSLSDLNLL